MGHEDFMEEVQDLNLILDKTITHCDALNNTSTLEFVATKWNPSFSISYQDCVLIMSKLGVRQELRDRYDADPYNLPQPQGRIPGC